jgi:hypothetical protein
MDEAEKIARRLVRTRKSDTLYCVEGLSEYTAYYTTKREALRFKAKRVTTITRRLKEAGVK